MPVQSRTSQRGVFRRRSVVQFQRRKATARLWVAAASKAASGGGAASTYSGNALTFELNRLAGYPNPPVAAQKAANLWAGTTGLALQGALNAKNGSTGLAETLCLNLIAGTTGLAIEEAARRCTA